MKSSRSLSSSGLLSCLTNPPCTPFSLFLKPTFSLNVPGLSPHHPSPFSPPSSGPCFWPSLPIEPFFFDFPEHLPRSLHFNPALRTLSPPSHDPTPPFPVIPLKPHVSISVGSHSCMTHIKLDSRCVRLGVGGRNSLGQHQHLSCMANIRKELGG
ncbi:hypothetical protein PBY51_023344 [Eleginops maclovinus]|nr:hypothetical protein PBY51_023344 [Eleginops maclovinus]